MKPWPREAILDKHFLDLLDLNTALPFAEGCVLGAACFIGSHELSITAAEKKSHFTPLPSALPI